MACRAHLRCEAAAGGPASGRSSLDLAAAHLGRGRASLLPAPVSSHEAASACHLRPARRPKPPQGLVEGRVGPGDRELAGDPRPSVLSTGSKSLRQVRRCDGRGAPFCLDAMQGNGPPLGAPRTYGLSQVRENEVEVGVGGQVVIVDEAYFGPKRCGGYFPAHTTERDYDICPNTFYGEDVGKEDAGVFSEGDS
jgi:hypothetical protein